MLRVLAVSAVVALAAAGELDDFAGEWTAVKVYGKWAASPYTRVQGCMDIILQPTGNSITCGEMDIHKTKMTINYTLIYPQWEPSQKQTEVLPGLYVLKNHDKLRQTLRNIKTTDCNADSFIEKTIVYRSGKNTLTLYGGDSDGMLLCKIIPTGNELVNIIATVDGDFKDVNGTTWDCDRKTNTNATTTTAS